MKKKLKIIFIGIPDMAYICLDDLVKKKFDIAGVIPPKKDHITSAHFKEFVKDRGLNLIDFENTPNDPGCIEAIKALDADIGVVCAYDVKLSKDFLNTTKMGYINCHPSLLPDYRGAMPYFHIIKNGEKKSGITLHFMDENFDTGDIIYQKQFEILPWETMGILFNRTNYMLSDALCKVLSDIQEGQELERKPQIKNSVFKTAPGVEGNFRINWQDNVFEIQNLVRACNPFYNAITTFRGVSCKIIKASAIEKETQKTSPEGKKSNADTKEQCGRIIQADRNSLFIAAGNGFLSVEIIQVGCWGTFGTREFYYTFSPKCEEFFR